MTPTTRAPRRLFATLTLLGLFLVAGAAAGRAAGPEVVVLPATGVVDNVMADYLVSGVASAAGDGAAAVVIRLNTPGGSLDSMQRIVTALLEAPIPTIVWVAPAGGRAASAGTFITLAANLAYMAPGTNIGAASPIDSSGQDIPGTLGVKVRNDAIANITSIAQARGRNVDWAVSTVASAVSSSATDAVSLHAVNGIAATLDDVRTSANGQVVTVAGGRQVTLDLAGAVVTEKPMNPILSLLQLLSDPNIAFVLFVIGGLGIAVEFIHPNLLSGITGALAMILAFIGFGSLPLNVGGALLVVLGLVLFVLETQIVSHGLLTLAGLVCLALGGSALYTAPISPTEPLVQVAPPLLIVTTGAAALLSAMVTIAAIRTRRMGSSAGTVGVPVPVGSEGVVQAPLDPLGTAYLAGEAWSARTLDGTVLPRDSVVRLVGWEGLVAVVEPVPGHIQSPPGAAAPAPRP